MLGDIKAYKDEHPELSAEADRIVFDIEKAKTYSAKIGRIRFF